MASVFFKLLVTKTCTGWCILEYINSPRAACHLSSGVLWIGISQESISLFTHKPLGKCSYQENTSDEWDIPSYPTRNCGTITILYHAIKNTVANPFNTARNGKGQCNTVKDTTAFLFSAHWLYFLLHGINHKSKHSCVLEFFLYFSRVE